MVGSIVAGLTRNAVLARMELHVAILTISLRQSVAPSWSTRVTNSPAHVSLILHLTKLLSSLIYNYNLNTRKFEDPGVLGFWGFGVLGLGFRV